MTGPRNDDIRLAGKAVTVSYLADPVVGHGRFEIDNQSAEKAEIQILGAWMKLGSDVRELSGWSIFDLGSERTLDPDGFIVEPGTKLDFLLTFPRIPHEPQFDARCSIALRAMAGSLPISAESVIVFERRIPFRH